MEEANKWWFSKEKTKEQIERKLEAAKRFLRAMTKFCDMSGGMSV